MPTIERIFPEYIRLDGGTQPRAKINQKICDEYGERMKAGEKFPPVDVFFDGENYWLVDGFHRVQAYVMAVPGEAIECNVFKGSLQDAQWHSYSVNKAHGLRRTERDKARVVREALAHPEAANKSNVEIAEHCGVNESTVRRHRKKIGASSSLPKMRQVTRGTTTYSQNTTHIGKKPKGSKAKPKSRKQGKRISPDAAIPVLGHSLPNPAIALNLSPTNPVMAAATIFKLFDSTFIRALIAELTQRLKGEAQ
jgi:hypothetical protein